MVGAFLSRRRCAVVAAVFSAAIFSLIVFFFRDRNGILDGVEFSASYENSSGGMLKVFLTGDEKYRIFRPIAEFPEEFISSILVQEDRRFFHHNGVNIVSVFRAAFETYVRRSRVIGASTITMQTAKLRYKINSRSVGGKLAQILFSYRMEMRHSKQEILEAYLNLAPCGRNIEGFEAAARYFFGKGMPATTFDEQILLCVLPQNPVKRCPSKDSVPPELSEAMGRLSESVGGSVVVPNLVCAFPDEAIHYSRHLSMISSSRKIVRTTIDSAMQEIVSRQIVRYVNMRRTIGIKNACAVLLDSESMEIRAYCGSANFYDNSIRGQVDGNSSRRSPGSTLKPFIYALALDQGKIHSHTLLKDTPVAFSEYAPDNYGNDFKGPLKAYEALIQSRNVPAVALARSLSNPDLYGFLANSGVYLPHGRDFYGLSIVLGSADVSPLDLCRLYSAFLNDGIARDILGEEPVGERRILSAESAFVVRKMLCRNAAPDGYSEPPFETGFKTGTSIGFKDAWTAGFFGKYVLVVWIGNFDGVGNNAFLGRSAAAPLFFNIALELMERGFVKRFASRAEENGELNVKEIDVCSVSGAIPNGDCPSTEKAYFIPGVSPIEKCKVHRVVSVGGKKVLGEFWTSDLLELFELAGLPRDSPAAEFNDGKPPQILSPLSSTEYILDKKRASIVLNASADSDAGELFWFSGTEFLARSKPNEKVEWRPSSTGKREITVTDSRGRSSSRIISVSSIE